MSAIRVLKPRESVKSSSARDKRNSGDEPDFLSPVSLNRSVSPPPFDPNRAIRHKSNPLTLPSKSDTAQVEAGEVEIDDHVSFFSSKLLVATRPPVDHQPRLSHSEWLALYHRNLNNRGHHFVVHQHDHPIAGTHYDLRLQCNATSSISFAIMYGLPGDPNSRKLNRNATETRVHNLWNHLIETASHETGTMLLWDTGEYEVLPYEDSKAASSRDHTTTTDESDTDADKNTRWNPDSEPQKLHRDFQKRKIKLRLHGTRLPTNYTLKLRLTRENDRIVQPDAPSFKRRRKNNNANTSSASTRTRRSQPERLETSSDSSETAPQSPVVEQGDRSNDILSISSSHNPSSPASSTDDGATEPASKRARISSPTSTRRNVSSLVRTASPPTRPNRFVSSTQAQSQSQSQFQSHARPESPPSPSSKSDTQIQVENAYPGARNTISSIHQRRWYLSLDRAASGFQPTNTVAFGRRVWERGPASESGFEPFYVRGRDVETSVVTGRTAADVAKDEGVEGFKPRRGWRGIED